MLNKLKRSFRRYFKGDVETSVQAFAIIITVVLVFYPLFWILISSFRESAFETSLTLRWYKLAFSDPRAYRALGNTLVFAGGSTLLATLIGVTLAWLTSRTNMPGQRLFSIIAILPFITTPMISAVAWSLLAWPRQGMLNLLLRSVFHLNMTTGPLNIISIWGMIWICGIYLSPYVFLFTSGALKSMDPSLEEASRISGGGNVKTLFTITLPIVSPAILGGALLAFVMSCGQFGIPGFIGTPAGINVLTTLIYRKVSSWPTQREYASALALMLLIITMLGIYVQTKLLQKRQYTTVSGRGFRPNVINLGKWKYAAMAFCILYLLVTVILPYSALIYTSFLKYLSTKISVNLLTCRNYINLFTVYPLTLTALRNSFIYAFVGATMCILLSAVISFITTRTNLPGKRLLNYISMVPASVPGIVFGVGLLVAYLRPPLMLYGTMWILLLAYITLFIPYGVRSTSASFMQVHKELEEGARLSGASWLRTFRHITIPLIKPGMFAGWTLVFITLMRELSASILLYTPRTVVSSVVIWDMWDEGTFTELCAFAMILTLLIVVTMAVLYKFFGVKIAHGGGHS